MLSEFLWFLLFTEFSFQVALELVNVFAYRVIDMELEKIGFLNSVFNLRKIYSMRGISQSPDIPGLHVSKYSFKSWLTFAEVTL